MLISETAKKRYDAFWAGEAYERCCMYISALKEETAPYPSPESLIQKWEDIELRAAQALWQAENFDYFAEGFPTSFVNCGPGCLSAMIGGEHTWSNYTVWFESKRVITDWRSPPEPRIQKDSAMYRLVDALTLKQLEAGAGKFYTSITDIGGAYDIVAALRGTWNLLTDMYDYPDEILAYVSKQQKVWLEYFEYYSDLLIKRQGAMTSWMPIWSSAPYYPLQCDYSAMISPDMFKKFVLPDLKYLSEQIGRTIYHLDGPEEIPHIKHILSLPELNAIQWVPGAAYENPGSACWFELYEEIQAAGKGLVLFDICPEDVENLLKHVSQKGLYISCRAYDAESAEEIIKIAESLA